ncbi:MAG: hypothetical protein GEV13_33515 [Rhodospirillales bacterium]|nr:hypothetical protein [Rhodospirillales bacterium]
MASRPRTSGSRRGGRAWPRGGSMNAPQLDFSAMRFSTDDLPARHREAMFREFFGRAVMKLDLEPLSDDPFHADVTVRRIPGLDLVSSVVSPGRASRTPALVADGNDDVSLLICSSAGTAFQRRRETRYGVGVAIVIMNAEPDTVCFPSGGRFLSLQMPRAALTPLVTDLDNAALLPPIPPSNETLQYLLNYIRFLQADGALGNPELARAAAIHVRDLAVLMLGATRDAGVVAERRGLRVARLEAIRPISRIVSANPSSRLLPSRRAMASRRAMFSSCSRARAPPFPSSFCTSA